MNRIQRKFHAQIDGLLIAIAGTLVMAACVERPAPYAVTIVEGNRFAPAALTVPVGTTVVWDNRSQDRHVVLADPAAPAGEAVRLPTGAAAWASGELFHNQRWEHTFDAPGVYLYVCAIHGAEDMVGTILVEE